MPFKGLSKKKVLVSIILIFILAVALFNALKPQQEQITEERLSMFEESGYDKDYFNFINQNMVSGGPPKDGIPAIDNPKYITAEEADTLLEDNDKVFGFEINGVAKAIPQDILYWHEIVNDKSNGEQYSVTYCPLTGTVIGFQGKNLGVSGKLYNSNLVMYDRETESEIPQILEKGVNGPLQGQELEKFYVYTTTWKQWKESYPHTIVLSRSTGYPTRDYERNPYPGYDSLLTVWFPVAAKSDLFQSKKIMHAVTYKNDALAIPKKEFKTIGEATYTLGGETIKLQYNPALDVIKVYDQEGRQINSYDTFWFAWYAYHPNTQIFTA